MSDTPSVTTAPGSQTSSDVHEGLQPEHALRPAPPAAQPEPAVAGPLRAILSRWWLVLLVTAACVAGAVAAAQTREPTYTATVDVNVGRTDVRVQALPGYVAGANALASSYSRIVTSDQITEPLARERGTSGRAIRERISASPIPDAPIFRITAEADGPREAIDLANAATRRMEVFVRDQETADRSTAVVLRDYRRQAAIAARRRTALDRLQAANAADSRVERAQVEYDLAQLKTTALGAQYQERSQETAATAGLQVLSRPREAADDRQQTLQEFVTVGIIAGVLIGSALALLLDRAATRRRLRRAAAP